MTIIMHDLAGADPDLRFSPYCWRSRYALAHKGLPVETIPWRFTDTNAIAFSGQGRVPVIKDGDKVVAEWRIVPSPGSRPDANAPPFVPQVQRVSPAQRALQNGKAKKPAVAAQQAARGPSPGTVVAKAQTLNPPPSGPTIARRPMTRRPLTTTKSLDDAKPAPVDVTRRLIQRRPLKRRA